MSEPAAAEDTSVAVDRLDAVCLVASDQSSESVRSQIDRIARTRLEAALAQAMQQLGAGHDSSVWLIRELEAGVSLGLDDSSENGLARDWADGIVRALAETLTAGPDGDRVIRFPSRGAFLARFAADVATGRAWDRWWYASFETLRSLPPGAAVREALAATPADGLEALALLEAENSVEPVLDTLSERDAHILLGACFADVRRPRGSIDTAFAASVLSALGALPRRESPTTAKNTLRIIVACGVGASAPRWVVERLLAVVALARAVGAEECVRALRTADIASAARADPSVGALLSDLVELAAAEPSLVARAASVAEPSARAARSGSTLLTEFGGAFLLLPAALELDLPHLEADSAAVRLQVLARCVGARDPAAASDPGLLLAAGADSPLLDLPAELDPAVPRLLLERLVRLGRVEGRCLAAELAPTPHGTALVLRDLARDAWAYAAPADDAQLALERGLRLVREASELRCECVLLGPGLESCAPAVDAEVVVTRADLHAVPNALEADLEHWLAHARPPNDLDSLSFPETPPAPDLTWSLVAHAIVRGLSGRLLGFDLSGVTYLQQNFLRIRATVRVTDGSIDVALAASPLQVVFQFAGVDGKTFTVPWLDTGEITLRLVDG